MEDKTMIIVGTILVAVVLFVLILIPASKSDVLGAMGKDKLNFNFNPSPTGYQIDTTQLQMQDIKVGTSSAQVETGDKITVDYIGALLNGQQFDSTYAKKQPYSLVVGAGEVIVGFDRGVMGMKVGGKRRLIIPASMAYGEKGQGPIPPNAPIQFIVELRAIQKADKVTPSKAPGVSSTPIPTPTNAPSNNNNSNNNPTSTPNPTPTDTPADSPTPTPE